MPEDMIRRSLVARYYKALSGEHYVPEPEPIEADKFPLEPQSGRRDAVWLGITALVLLAMFVGAASVVGKLGLHYP